MTEQAILATVAIAPLLFLLTAYFTRARRRRVVAVLVGGIIAAAMNAGWDMLAFRNLWWHYVFVPGDTAPLLLYVPVALVYGGAFGLLGWRAMRADGWRGALGFFAAFVAFGFVRDHVIAAQGTIFVFDPGWLPHLVDAGAYLSLALAVQLTMLVLVGRPGTDRLRGR